MGVLPLQFLDGESPDKLKLTGREKYTIHLDEDLRPQQHVNVEVIFIIKSNSIINVITIRLFI
jgi:aconitate hydratase